MNNAFGLLSLFTTKRNLHRTFGWTSHVRVRAVRTFDWIRAVSIVFMDFTTLETFRFMGTPCCFVAELLTTKTTIDLGERFVRKSRITNAIDEDVLTLENDLNVVIWLKVHSNTIDRLTIVKDTSDVKHWRISLSDQRLNGIDSPFTGNTMNQNRIRGRNTTRWDDFEREATEAAGLRGWLQK